MSGEEEVSGEEEEVCEWRGGGGECVRCEWGGGGGECVRCEWGGGGVCVSLSDNILYSLQSQSRSRPHPLIK